jgi:hypothetical protein
MYVIVRLVLAVMALAGLAAAVVLAALGQLVWSLIPAVVALLALIAITPRRKTLVGSGVLALLTAYFIVGAHFVPSGDTLHATLRLLDPEQIEITATRTGSGHEEGEVGLGTTALALLVGAYHCAHEEPILVWDGEPWQFFPFTSQEASAGASTRITCGPREWLKTDETLIPVEFVAADDPEAEQIAVRIGLPQIGEASGDDTFVWSPLPASVQLADDRVVSGYLGDELINRPDVLTYSVECQQEVRILVNTGPAAAIPTSSTTFWIGWIQNGQPLESISLARLRPETSGYLGRMYGLDTSWFRNDTSDMVDIWGVIATDLSHMIVPDSQITLSEQRSLLILGEGGEVCIDGQARAAFEGPFFALVESRGGHRNTLSISAQALGLVLPGGRWNCGCPLFWVFDRTSYETAAGRVLVRGGIGELQVGGLVRPFNEFDTASLSVDRFALVNRRDSPHEYVLAGEITAAALNGQAMADLSVWAQIPPTIQQVIFALFAAALGIALGAILKQTGSASKSP